MQDEQVIAYILRPLNVLTLFHLRKMQNCEKSSFVLSGD